MSQWAMEDTNLLTIEIILFHFHVSRQSVLTVA